MVSIIIPVYNVSDYIDKCLESVVNQTFSEIEIILINDDSTDGSNEKCLEWAKKDKRIIYISKKNEGLGLTRNLGIKIAKYEYLAFIDSDDWWDLTAIEKMYNSITENDADMVFCDHYLCSFNYEDGTFVSAKSKAKKVYECPIKTCEDASVMYTINPGMVLKMYKKSLFIDNNITMPNIPYEDMAIYPQIVVNTKKVCQIKECLYYYRINRKESITNNPEYYHYVETALTNSIDYLNNSNLFKKYYVPINKYAMRHISGALRKRKSDLNCEEYKNFHDSLCNLYYKNFNDKYCNLKFVLWGSFNLSCIINNLIVDPDNLRHHYCFSGIISAVSDKLENIEISHENSYRKRMIEADLNKDFQLISKNETNDIDYLVIDLLEERHMIYKTGHAYFTGSDAFCESQNNILKYEVLDPFCNEELWKANCLKFISMLKSKYSANQIILVKTKLCGHFGEYGKERKFENIDDIKAINNKLESYYTFFENNFVGIKVLDPTKMKSFFTDTSFRHGCYPYHINECFYLEVSDMLRSII